MPSLPCAARPPAQCAHTRVRARDAHLMKMSYLSPLPHLHRDWAHLMPTTAPGLGSHLMPHIHRGWPRRCHICIGTGRIPATSAPRLGLPPPHLHRKGLGSPLPHLHRDWARRCHICTGTGPNPAASAPKGTGPTPAASAPKGTGLARTFACFAEPKRAAAADHTEPWTFASLHGRARSVWAGRLGVHR